DGLTNDGSGNYVCISANKEITYSTSACVGLSSKRYKHDITELGEIGLEQVMHMRPVSFIYDEDVSPNDQSLHLGFIAEEIDLINKDLVAYNEDGSVQSVKYNEFVPVIVKAIQELTKKVEDLISSLADKVVAIKEVVPGRLRIKDEVCVDEVCVTKDQFKALLIEARDGNPGVQHNDSNEEEENIETEEEPSGSTGESTETEEGTPDTEVVEEETEQTDVTEDTNVEEPESEETEEEVVEPEPEAESDDSDQDSSGDAGGEAAPAE
ncbi:MAG TPA: tail fiber domain-containing protein, partial [Candidatus Paceibacterota bacterium]|nr:tail fiber domain-containing protein [Candidatus Paceibacterota bacterium]